MALTQKNFADLITFSRNGVAMRHNAFGQLESVLANEPRFDFDPKTKQLLGLLIEEQKTNLLAVAADLTTGFSLSANLTPSVGSPAPMGQNYRRLTKIAAGTSNPISKTAVTLISGRNSASVHVKPGSIGTVTIRFFDTIGDAAMAVFDVSNGTIVRTSGSVLHSATLQPAEGGAWRVAVTADYTSRSTAGAGIYFYVGDVAQEGAAGDSIELWGPMLEAGLLTSYILTAGTQVTRPADIATVNNLSPWYNPVDSTLYIEAIPCGLDSTSRGFASLFVNGSDSNRLTLFRQSGGTGPFLWYNKPGTPDRGGKTLAPGGQVVKGAVAFNAAGARSISVNGVAATASIVTDGPVTSAFNTLALMRAYGTTNEIMSGHIRVLRYFPRRLSDAELQALTA